MGSTVRMIAYLQQPGGPCVIVRGIYFVVNGILLLILLGDEFLL